jgi:hypothetical protein
VIIVPRLLVLLGEISGLILFGFGGLATLLFLAADTPAEAIAKRVAVLPEQCEAGYLNHGSYACWYTMNDHPFLFTLSLVLIFTGGAVLYWAHRRMR